MKKIWTPDGLQQGLQQSWVGKGESIINYDQGKATLVDKGTKGVDNQPSSVSPNDDNVIAGNDVDWTTGIKFSDQIAPMTAAVEKINQAEKHRDKYGHLSSLSKATQSVTNQEKQKLMSAMQEITDRQAQQHQIEQEVQEIAQQNNTLTRARRGKLLYADDGKDLPEFEEGKTINWRIPWIQRMTPGIIGSAAALGKLNWWMRNPIQYHSTYSPNYNENRALQIMAENRVNPYASIRAAQDAERRGNFQLMQQGGLTGGQRYLGRIATTLGNAQNMANIYADAELKNANLRNTYAEALGKFGTEDATRRQNAYQHDWQDYVAAHGRKVKGIERSIADTVSQVQNAYQNEFKYRFGGYALNQYDQQLDNEQKRFYAALSAAHPTQSTTNSPTTTASKPVVMNLYGQYPTSQKIPYLEQTQMSNKYDWRTVGDEYYAQQAKLPLWWGYANQKGWNRGKDRKGGKR